MQVYIVEGRYDAYDLSDEFLGVYSTREKAQEALERFSQTKTYDYYTIRTAIMDVDGYKPAEEFSYDEY